MHFWLLCCAVLFMGAQGYGWMSQQDWHLGGDLPLPWVILGGIGLAIASNRKGLLPQPPRAAPPLQEASSPEVQTASLHQVQLTNSPERNQGTPISFEIKRNPNHPHPPH